MNEGTLAMLIQWCMLCLVWMGSLDRLLREVGLSRRNVLAAMTVTLLCTFASWKLSFAPVQISLSGTLLPLVACGWLYTRVQPQKRRFHLIASIGIAWSLFWLRWVFFSDPVLLVWDERILLPTVAVIMVSLFTRSPLSQLFSLLFSLEIADTTHGFYFWKWSGACILGDEYAQDLLWSSLSGWSLYRLVWTVIKRMAGNRAEPSNPEDA
ncbi:YphA family membrane protein [Brevibacillus sp. TJ4]|uniref:YphA family membrane protein n=1 Tax=Brevibacillus sp. TJ4 TaxID=3234853 RepID=UPI0037D5EF97